MGGPIDGAATRWTGRTGNRNVFQFRHPGAAVTTSTLAVDLTDLDTFVRGVPHDQFDLLRAEAPVYFHPETEGAGFWCITRADDLHKVSQTWEVFSSEWGITVHEAPSEEDKEWWDGVGWTAHNAVE